MGHVPAEELPALFIRKSIRMKDRPNAASGFILCFEYQDIRSAIPQGTCCRQSGKAGADHGNIN
jgi:hypothetical protein